MGVFIVRSHKQEAILTDHTIVQQLP